MQHHLDGMFKHQNKFYHLWREMHEETRQEDEQQRQGGSDLHTGGGAGQLRDT